MDVWSCDLYPLVHLHIATHEYVMRECVHTQMYLQGKINQFLQSNQNFMIDMK